MSVQKKISKQSKTVNTKQESPVIMTEEAQIQKIDPPAVIESVAIESIENKTPIILEGGVKKRKVVKKAKETKETKEVKNVEIAPVVDVQRVEATGGKSPKKVQRKSAKKETKKEDKKEKKEDIVNLKEDDIEDDNDDIKTRSFKVQLPGEQNFAGRFTGLTPYQAANKALSKFFRSQNGVEVVDKSQVEFSIRESTRGSKRLVYNYKGNRIRLETPITYTIKSVSGEDRVITKQFKNQLIKIKKTINTKQPLIESA